MMSKKYAIKNRRRFAISLTILLGLLITVTYITIAYASEKETVKEDRNEIKQVKVDTKSAIETTAQAIEVIQEPVINQTPVYNITLSKELQDFTYNQCEYMDVAYELELAILYTESKFDSQAVSYTGACRGMGQLSRTTEKGLAESLQIQNYNVFNAQHNISCSVYLVKQLRDYWREQGYSEEDVTGLTLLSYNRGIDGCKRYISNHDIYDDKYVNLILDRKSQLEQYHQFLY